jgi:hypothetical protein
MRTSLRAFIISAALTCFAVALIEPAHAQSTCLASETAKELLSKAGIPMSEAQLLVLALTPDSTVESSQDQITQTSPTFAKRSAVELKTEDKNLDKAQQFVKSMPITEDAQSCIQNMQKIRDNIKKELLQRENENIPETFSPNQLRELAKEQSAQAAGQKYTPNPMSSGEGRNGGRSRPPVIVPFPLPFPGEGNCGPGANCRMGPAR